MRAESCPVLGGKMKDYIHEASLMSTMQVSYGRLAETVPATAIDTRPANLNAPCEAGGERASARDGWYVRTGKRVVDVILVFLSLPVALLLIGLCALALKLEGGAAFYWQDRIGRDGRKFRILKLRTMVMDADARLEKLLQENPLLRAEWEETQKLKSDPRITIVGNFLRKTSLDELPQLWNVLIGDMSLVGPRPMLPEQLPLYGPPAAYYALRPGITGTWQVSARNESRFSDRAIMDAEYRRELGFWTDAKLLYLTIGVVMRRTGY